MTSILVTTFSFSPSVYPPLAIGFFGLGMGYFVWGGQALFGFPPASPESDRSIGLWGIWMPGFMQFITGVYLLIGLTWFNVFGVGAKTSPLYTAAVAFTAYGVHWFVLGYRRYIQSDVLPDAWMAIPFFLISVLGIVVFAAAKDWGVVILFVLLSLIYLSEALTRFGLLPSGRARTDVPGGTVPRASTPFTGIQLVGFWQFLNGWWLMYLTWAVVLDFSTNYHWPF